MKRSLFWCGGLLALVMGLGLPRAHAQTEAPAAKAAEGRPVADMGTRFQMLERYAIDDASRPGSVGQYRVGIRGTSKTVIEQPQGAPVQEDAINQTIYTERPARVSEIGAVQATLRRYEAFRQTPSPSIRPSQKPPLEGMSIWYQPHPGGDPLVLSLTDGRGLREFEYLAVHQQIFTPALVALLPVQPSRIGDRWSVSKLGTWALLGESPGRGTALLAQLQVVQQAAEGTDWEAIITITGRVALPDGDTAVNARLAFRFPPPPPPDQEKEAKPIADHQTVQARGAITELRMTTVVSSLVSEANTRLKRTTTQKLTLARRFGPQAGEILAIPEAVPTATEDNSWLLFEDPEENFYFRHPQDFQLGPLTNRGDSAELLRGNPKAPDRIEFLLQHKTGDPQADRNNRSPDFHLKLLNETWNQQKQDILRGPSGWLPDADWAPSKMKVFRINAALRSSGGAAKRDARVHFDQYIVQFGREESLVVKSTTVQDPPANFRKQVEAILKTFRLGPSTVR